MRAWNGYLLSAPASYGVPHSCRQRDCNRVSDALSSQDVQQANSHSPRLAKSNPGRLSSDQMSTALRTATYSVPPRKPCVTQTSVPLRTCCTGREEWFHRKQRSRQDGEWFGHRIAICRPSTLRRPVSIVFPFAAITSPCSRQYLNIALVDSGIPARQPRCSAKSPSGQY